MVDVKEDAGDAWWHYTINYGPDGEENYANVYAPGKDLVSNLKIHHARAIVAAMNDKLLATPEAEPGLIDEIHELAGMVGATFTPHEKPTPEAEPVVWRKGDIAVAVMSTQDGLTKDKEYVVLDAKEDTISILDNDGRTHFRMTHYFTHPSPPIKEAEVEAAQSVLNERIFDDGGVTNAEIPGMVRDMLTAFLKARRQG